MVFKGYWGLPEDTAYAFRGGWHHTGDLGRLDEEGFLWFAGRKPDKELIKPGGENVYPAEVEKAILQHPAVAQTVVFGVPDPKWKEGIKAVCRLNPGQTLEASELIQFVGEQIASFKKPQYVEFVDEMPSLKDGSVDRAEVKKLYSPSIDIQIIITALSIAELFLIPCTLVDILLILTGGRICVLEFGLRINW